MVASREGMHGGAAPDGNAYGCAKSFYRRELSIGAQN